MIIDFNRQVTHLMYVAEDGNWGDAAGMVIVDTENWDKHQIDYLGECLDHERTEYARWASLHPHRTTALNSSFWVCEECRAFYNRKGGES